MSTEFHALRVFKTDEGQETRLISLSDADLTDDDVDVRVEYSTLNYKDGLAMTGRAPVVRTWPLTPGIDLAGIVERSEHRGFQIGDRVVLNGCGVGETHHGGFACPAPRRAEAQRRLAVDLDMKRLDAMARQVGLEEVPALASDILDGKVRSRIVIDVNR
jgi:hypothetical protein